MDYKWYFMYNEVKWTFQTKGGKKEKQMGTFGIRNKNEGVQKLWNNVQKKFAQSAGRYCRKMKTFAVIAGHLHHSRKVHRAARINIRNRRNKRNPGSKCC